LAKAAAAYITDMEQRFHGTEVDFGNRKPVFRAERLLVLWNCISSNSSCPPTLTQHTLLLLLTKEQRQNVLREGK
jgi:hypothetical protein